MNHVRSILSALLTVVGMCVATLIAPVPLWAQGQQTLTRVFFVDESKQSLQWAELIAGEKPTMTSVREISGFPKLDPQKQAISSLQAVGGMMLVGIRTLDDADAPAGWLLIESGAYEEAHGDHSHWIYPYAPRIRAAQFDEQTRGPDRVAVIDRGDLAVVRAVPDDPVNFFRGRFKSAGPNTDQLRAQERAADERAEKAKARRVKK